MYVVSALNWGTVKVKKIERMNELRSCNCYESYSAFIKQELKDYEMNYNDFE